MHTERISKAVAAFTAHVCEYADITGRTFTSTRHPLKGGPSRCDRSDLRRNGRPSEKPD